MEYLSFIFVHACTYVSQDSELSVLDQREVAVRRRPRPSRHPSACQTAGFQWKTDD